MKKIIAAAMAAAMTVSCAALAETQITVGGNGSVSVPADTASVYMGVSEYADTAIEAQSLANEKIAAIRTACTEAGIPESDISVSAINLNAVSDYSEDSTPTITSYNAFSSLEIRVSDIDKVGAVIDASIAAGANSMSGVSFSLKDSSAYNQEVISAACAEARAKADLYAEALGMSITGVVSINETYTDVFEDNAASFSADAVNAGTDLGVNNVSVVSSVTVTYTAE